MSKRHRNKPIQRASMPMTTATSGNVVTIPSSVWQAMLNSMAPQKGQAQTFSPGAPLEPIPGITPAAGPRQFAFMPGANLVGNDRTQLRDYIPAFEQLRLLAQTYSGIGMAERIWCDLIPRMELQVTIRPELKAQGADDKQFPKEISAYRTFFEKPDGYDDIHTWLRKAIVEQTQIDALVLFKRRNRGGTLQGLDIVDGAIMKPLLDERGRMPVPPYAAFQQYAYGTPGQGYTTDEMIYYRESPRTFTPYGFSRVERIILLVNQALRKQKKDLARFTEGTIPEGIMEVPDSLNWSPDQIDAYEQMWNSLLAGNIQQQVRIKFTQPGMKYTAFDQFESKEHLTEFDRFLLNITLGNYGLSMGDAGFTEDIHKSADEGQENMLYRRTIDPLAAAYGHILTNVLRDDFHDDRFIVRFGGYDETEDLQTQATAFSVLIQNALISPSDAAAKLGLPDIPKTGPLLVTKSGIVPLANYELGSDMRTASDQASIAGFQLAANPPQPDNEETDDESTQPPEGKQAKPGSKPAKDGAGKARTPTHSPEQNQQGDGEKRYTMSELVRLLEGTATADESRETASIADGRAIALELNLWKDRAIDDLKRARTLRGFTTTIIPEALHTRIHDALSACQSVQEVKDTFRQAKESLTQGVSL
jgi:hypothetical protein